MLHRIAADEFPYRNVKYILLTIDFIK